MLFSSHDFSHGSPNSNLVMKILVNYKDINGNIHTGYLVDIKYFQNRFFTPVKGVVVAKSEPVALVDIADIKVIDSEFSV